MTSDGFQVVVSLSARHFNNLKQEFDHPAFIPELNLFEVESIDSIGQDIVQLVQNIIVGIAFDQQRQVVEEADKNLGGIFLVQIRQRSLDKALSLANAQKRDEAHLLAGFDKRN